MGMYKCECRCRYSSEEGARSPGAGGTKGCEPSDIGAGTESERAMQALKY